MSRPSVSDTGKEPNLSWSRPATRKLRAKMTIAMVQAIDEPVRFQPRLFSRHVTKALQRDPVERAVTRCRSGNFLSLLREGEGEGEEIFDL